MAKFTLRRVLTKPEPPKKFDYVLVELKSVPLGVTYYLYNPLTTSVVPYKRTTSAESHVVWDRYGEREHHVNVYVDSKDPWIMGGRT